MGRVLFLKSPLIPPTIKVAVKKNTTIDVITYEVTPFEYGSVLILTFLYNKIHKEDIVKNSRKTCQ
jgi:hypothetical protein